MSSQNQGTTESEEDLIIDCHPYDVYGDETVESEEDNVINKDYGKNILDDLNFKLNASSIFENIGFQSLLAIGIFGIIYFVADYVFKRMPKRLLDRRIQQGS